jgi:hypothetical protein
MTYHAQDAHEADGQAYKAVKLLEYLAGVEARFLKDSHISCGSASLHTIPPRRAQSGS